MVRIISIAFLLILMFLLTFTACKKDSKDTGPDVVDIPLIPYHSIRSFPHDTLSFTEGFLFTKNSLFESTGSPVDLIKARSVFGPVDLESGKIDVKVELNKEVYFGEGICYLRGHFYQLTYKNKVGFIYDAVTYGWIGQFSFLSNEGWGLTTDGESLIMSDGTDKLTYIDPHTFLVTKILTVTNAGAPTRYLNELEFINGYIYANIWRSNNIVKIDTSDGKVNGFLDLTALADEAKGIYPGSMEMNGIAYNPTTGNVFITGKLWPKIFEIVLFE